MGEQFPRTKFQGFTPMPKSFVVPAAEDKLGMVKAARNTIALDTGAGQLTHHVLGSAAFEISPLPWRRRVVPDFNPYSNPDTLKGYENWFEEFENATSPEEVEFIKARIDTQVDLRTSLNDYGGTRFVANIFDPINLLPMGMAYGKGFGAGAKFAMSTGTAPFAASELVRHGIDPTATKLETLLNIGGGMAFMGLMGGAMGKWSPDPEAIKIGNATVRALDAIVPIQRPQHGTTQMSVGVPMGYGTLGKIFERTVNAFKSTANKIGVSGESLGKIVRRKDGQGNAAGTTKGAPKNFHKVDSEWYPREYVERGADAAFRIYNQMKMDLKELKGFLRFPDHIKLRAEQSGLAEADVKKIIEDGIATREAELKQADEFFVRDDVQKQIQLEREMGPEATGTVKDLDEYELVNSQELELYEGVPANLRNEILEFTEIIRVVKDRGKQLGTEIDELKAKVEGATRKTEQTKYGRKLEDVIARKQRNDMDQRIAEAKLSEVRQVIATKNAQELVRDWNLAPAALNKIMQSTKQFPWWYLLKNDFRDIDPVLGQQLQEFALAMASSPGLNTFGTNMYRSLGPSIEALIHEYTGPFVKAKKIKERQYTKYLGLGEDTGQFQTFWIDTAQRFHAKRKAFAEGRGRFDEDSPGFTGPRDPNKERPQMTLSEWNTEVSRALIVGKHDIPEIMVAAQAYRDIWNDMGKAAKKLEIYQTQRKINFNLFEARKEKKELTKTMKSTKVRRRNEMGEMEDVWVPRDLKDKPITPAEQGALDRLEMDIMALEKRLEAYEAAGSTDLTDAGYFHVMYDPHELRAKREQVVDMLVREFKGNGTSNHVTRVDDEIIRGDTNDVELKARAEETYSSLLREAELGESERGINTTEKRAWLEKRFEEHAAAMKGTPLEGRKSMRQLLRDLDRQDMIDKEKGIEHGSAESKAIADEYEATLKAFEEMKKTDPELATKFARNEIIGDKLAEIANGTPSQSAGPLLQRTLNIDNDKWLELGVINTDIDQVMSHYIFRMAPAIETAKKFGTATGQTHIKKLKKKMDDQVALLRKTDPKKADKLAKKAEEYEQSMNDLRDVVHGFLQTTQDPSAITGRILRALRNFNVLASMGRSSFMALGDTGNIVISQGFRRTFGYAYTRMMSGIHGGNVRMIDSEVELAGAVVEVALGMRYRSVTETGSAWWAGSKFEKGLGDGTQRFFMHNLLGPWTDMASKVAGGLIQSRIIENAVAWKAGKLSPKEAKVMNRLNIDKETAFQIAEEWSQSGKLKHKAMFIANTTEWASDVTRSKFRAAMNDEIRRAVIIPGAVDKPTALLKSEWWKIFGQYKGFGLSASNRVFAAGLQQEGGTKISGMLSMLAIAGIVDSYKRPDYIEMSVDEQILRAVELSGLTGIILDVNDTIERISGGAVGVRPLLGMDIRERNPNWANRVGALAGAVPNQWLTLMYGLTSDEASTNDAARGIRYMLPYSNFWAFNSQVNKIQRTAVDAFEE